MRRTTRGSDGRSSRHSRRSSNRARPQCRRERRRVTSSLSSQNTAHTGPCRLLVKVGIIKQRRALTVESLRDPAVLIRESPDRDTDAASDIKARADDVGKVVTLSNKGGGGGGEGRVADVELGVGYFDAQSGESLQSGRERRARGRAAHDQVTLETDAVDGSTGCLDDLDQLEGFVGLGAVVFEVVVVVVAGSQVLASCIMRKRGDKRETNSLVLGSAALAALKAMAK